MHRLICLFTTVILKYDNEKTVRKMTISYAHQETQYKTETIPYIRIKGKWLEKLGFKQGQKISIQVSDKKLTITTDDGLLPAG